MQIALDLNEKRVDTVGDMLLDVTHQNLHVVERFLVRDISVEHVHRDLELLSQSC